MARVVGGACVHPQVHVLAREARHAEAAAEGRRARGGGGGTSSFLREEGREGRMEEPREGERRDNRK